MDACRTCERPRDSVRPTSGAACTLRLAGLSPEVYATADLPDNPLSFKYSCRPVSSGQACTTLMDLLLGWASMHLVAGSASVPIKTRLGGPGDSMWVGGGRGRSVGARAGPAELTHSRLALVGDKNPPVGLESSLFTFFGSSGFFGLFTSAKPAGGPTVAPARGPTVAPTGGPTVAPAGGGVAPAGPSVAPKGSEDALSAAALEGSAAVLKEPLRLAAGSAAVLWKSLNLVTA